VLMPIQDELEMGSHLPDLVVELEKSPEYAVLFRRAFGDAEISAERIARSLAQFVRSMVSYQSPYDQALAAGSVGSGRPLDFTTVNSIADPDLVALGEIAFRTNCSGCHQSVAQVATDVHNNGLDAITRDEGAGDGEFKAPSLRNVGVRGRFMHDGRMTSLEEVIDFYADQVADHPHLSDRLPSGGLGLRLHVRDALVAFLHSLTDDSFLKSPLFSDPFTEGSIEFEAADVSRDRCVDGADVDLLGAAIRLGSADKRFDLNLDGQVDARDKATLLDALDAVLGDANLDGHAAVQDFAIVCRHLGGPGGWHEGDFDSNGQVDHFDLLLLLSHFAGDDFVRIVSMPFSRHVPSGTLEER
ncbi:MAG: cytochrome c peroxidase, partial [Planctomycetota bacterium]